jgi:hypothetical protein
VVVIRLNAALHSTIPGRWPIPILIRRDSSTNTRASCPCPSRVRDLTFGKQRIGLDLAGGGFSA